MAYHESSKINILNVAPSLIRDYGVVSVQVAEAMALGAQKNYDTDYAVSTTGNAGPSKGDKGKDLGTVCIAIAGPNGIVSEKFNFGNNRERVIQKTVNKVFEIFFKTIAN